MAIAPPETEAKRDSVWLKAVADQTALGQT
jgi:hypothetical protein